MILRETEGEQNGCSSGSYGICIVLDSCRRRPALRFGLPVASYVG